MKNIDVDALLSTVAKDEKIYSYFNEYRTREFSDCPASFRLLMSAVAIKRPSTIMMEIDKHRGNGTA